jgi:F5/8 type C domain-containing protein/glycosyl hydrolase family 64 (putative beta-1,3-glucanase)
MRHAIPRRRPRPVTAAVGALLLLLAGAYAAVSSGAAHAADTLLSQGRPATSSSTENGTFPASAAVDGNTGTRWSSAFGDPQWLQVDLGATATITSVTLNWEAAYARSFQIQTSANGSTWTTIYTTTTGAGGVQNLAVSGSGRYVRMNGTVRATPYGYSLWEFQVFGSGGQAPPPTGGATMPDSFWGDTAGIPAARNVVEVKVLNRTNGKYPDSQVYWSFNGQTHSIAEQPYLDMPANSAGRMYFYLGSPTSQYFDFIEFTVGPDVFNGNTTRVDAFGLKIALRLHSHDGADQQVGENYATFTEDRTATFNRFAAAVPAEFQHSATATAPYRILAPGSDPVFQPGGQYQNYLSSYASSVGVSATTQQIFGCSGPLASNANQCASLNRHTADLPAAQQQTVSNFYRAAPANYYAKFWHDNALGNLAYGFPYDDVAGQSTFISHPDPQYLLVAVGW